MEFSGKVARFARQIRHALQERCVVTEAELDRLLRTRSVILDPDWNLDVQTALNELAKQQRIVRLGETVVMLPEPKGTVNGEPMVSFHDLLHTVRAVLQHQQREAAQAAECMYEQMPPPRPPA